MTERESSPPRSWSTSGVTHEALDVLSDSSSWTTRWRRRPRQNSHSSRSSPSVRRARRTRACPPGLAGRPPSIADARHRLGEREDHVRRSSAPLDTSLALHDDRDLPLGGALGDDADVQVGLGEGAHEAGRHAGPHRHALAYDRDNGNVGEAYRVHVRAGELELERGPQGAAQRHG